MGYKNYFHHISLSAFLIINVKFFSNFQKEWCTFGKKNDVLRKKIAHFQGLNVLNIDFFYLFFISSFEHANFVINGKYSQNNYDNPNYYASLVKKGK
jgi:hypothetical protein